MTIRPHLKFYVLIVCFGLLLFSSAAAMVADVISHRAFVQERYWARGEPIKNVEQWQQAVSQVQTALKLAPGHTDYLFLLGRLGTWRLYVEESVDTDITPAIEQAYQAFSEGLHARPYWAEGWSEFAFLKAQLGEVDTDFEFMVYSSMITGPFEVKAILNILKATFSEWDNLSLDMQQEVRDLFVLAQTLSYTVHINIEKESLAIANDFGMLTKLCSVSEPSEQSRGYCESVLVDAKID